MFKRFFIQRNHSSAQEIMLQQQLAEKEVEIQQLRSSNQQLSETLSHLQKILQKDSRENPTNRLSQMPPLPDNISLLKSLSEEDPIQQLLDDLVKVNEFIKSGDDSIGYMTELVFAISLNSNDVKNSIQLLTNSIEEIYHVVETIEDFSFKTRLLSLNASIESHRLADKNADAFGFIAKEMKSLAEKTKGLTATILSYKERIDQELLHTTSTVEDSHEVVHRSVEQIDITASSFQNIAGILTDVSPVLDSIIQNLELLKSDNEKKDDFIKKVSKRCSETENHLEFLLQEKERRKKIMEDFFNSNVARQLPPIE